MNKLHIFIAVTLIPTIFLAGCSANAIQTATTPVSSNVEVASDDILDNITNSNFENEQTEPIEIKANRIFSEYGFSIEADYENLLIFPTNNDTDYDTLTNSLVDLFITADKDFYENQENSYTYIMQRYLMPAMMLFQGLDIDNIETHEEMSKIIVNKLSQAFKITTQDIVINDFDCKHIILTLDMTSVDENYKEYMPSLNDLTFVQTEIFTVPYPDNENKFYNIIFDGITNIETYDTLSEIAKIVSSFAYDIDMSQTNEQGLKSFKAISFSSFYNPNYFKTTLSPEHYNTILSYTDTMQLPLKLTDESENFYISVECDYFKLTNIDSEVLVFETQTINDKQFDVYKYNVSGQDVTVSVAHFTDEIYPNTTFISIDSFDKLSLDKLNSLNKDDIDIINDVFLNIMEYYEVSYSPVLKNHLDMRVAIGDSFEKIEPITPVPEITTEDGFVLQGTTLTGYIGDEKHIIIPDGVEIIGREAFKGNDNIESVVLSDTVKIVGDSAFMQSSLKEVTISNSVTEIKQYGFAYCTEMEVLNFGNSVEIIGDLAFNGSWSLKELNLPSSLKTIGETAFSSAKSIKTLVIPESVTEIKRNAFGHCLELESISLPNSLTAINDDTFKNCVKLNKIEIPNSITYIGELAFEDCENLTEVVLLNSNTLVSELAFKGCDNLLEIIRK